MTETAPTRSKWRLPPSTFELGTSRSAASTMPTPIGTLMKKIHSQESVSVRIPPSSRPTALPPDAIAAQIERALVRSAPSAKLVVMTASAAGDMSAAPRPCAARAPISISSEDAKPLTSEATEKSVAPAMKRLRRPKRSAARPPSRRKPPKSSV